MKGKLSSKVVYTTSSIGEFYVIKSKLDTSAFEGHRVGNGWVLEGGDDLRKLVEGKDFDKDASAIQAQYDFFQNNALPTGTAAKKPRKGGGGGGKGTDPAIKAWIIEKANAGMNGKNVAAAIPGKFDGKKVSYNTVAKIIREAKA